MWPRSWRPRLGRPEVWRGAWNNATVLILANPFGHRYPFGVMSSMVDLPKDPKKIRARIKSYERKLRQELKDHGCYRDGAGKRNFLGPLYLLMGDLAGAMDSFGWFQKNFSDDAGEPGHRLIWALALHRAGNPQDAKQKLREAMLLNLYMVPHLLEEDRLRLQMWHGCNEEWSEYLEEIPEAYFKMWDVEEIQWAGRLYRGEEFQAAERRWIQIHRELENERPGPRRRQLIDDASALMGPSWVVER